MNLEDLCEIERMDTMTDQTAPAKSDRFQTSSDDFVRFLESKNETMTCIFCQNESWTVICDFSDNGNAFRLTTPIRNAPKPGTVSYFTIHCQECGFLMNFLARIVHQWVQDNPISPDSDPGAAEEMEEIELSDQTTLGTAGKGDEV